ncbi:protein of unknown function [Streptantibioticus cattleyicolor NRRL 8057 = DSM 46488]|nr:protein of unknown function [Streptantibioticus cattleyicolor NRRL 8057 = DSM 46488]
MQVSRKMLVDMLRLQRADPSFHCRSREYTQALSNDRELLHLLW